MKQEKKLFLWCRECASACGMAPALQPGTLKLKTILIAIKLELIQELAVFMGFGGVYLDFFFFFNVKIINCD